MMLYQIAGLILFCFGLIYSTSLIIGAIKTLAIKSHLGAYGITALVLAISTSLPELVVSIVASIEGNTSLVLGNILGSNIVDLSLVIGVAAILGGSLKVTGTILSRDIYLTGAAGFLPIFLIADGSLSRPDGVVLLVVYLVMITTFLRSHHRVLAEQALSVSPMQRIISMLASASSKTSLAKFVFGVILLLASSHFIVQLSSALAISTGLSSLFIGLFIVSVGTSLPELAFEVKALASGQAKMAIGNLLGSVVANSTLILGLASIIRPLTLKSGGLLPYGLAIGTFTMIYFGFTIFIKSKKKLEWWEGLILILGYVVFVWLEFARS